MSEFKTSSECVEYICEQGCTFVREVIVSLEKNNSVEALKHLDDAEQQLVLVELKVVMSIYDLSDGS
jgi:hypothetical protein